MLSLLASGAFTVLGLLSSPLFASAAIVSSPTDVSNATAFDFIIVGAGTAGLVLANRLTENPHVNVLVIEAGGSDEGVLTTEVPLLAPALAGTALDWNYTTTAQTGLNGRSIVYTRGYGLGGTSTVNLLTWNRGSNDVWNHWANLTGDEGWAWNSVKKYHKKASHFSPSVDGHNTTGQISPSSYGAGPVAVSVNGYYTELEARVKGASGELGGRFKYNPDFNGGDNVGLGYMPASIGAGERSSSSTAYLRPVQNRTNLVVLLNTQVTKLITTATTNASIPIFNTVEAATGPTATRYQFSATKEVILSGGVIGTPQILLLSGIGPKEELAALNINSTVDAPEVGKNLVDHPLVAMYYQVNSTTTFDDILRNDTVFNEALAEWGPDQAVHQGPLSNAAAATQAYLRLPANSTIFQTEVDPASGPRSANTEILFVDGYASFKGFPEQPATGNYVTLLGAVVSPTSNGSITLASSDPFVYPNINPAFLTSPFDIFTIVQVMKDAATIAQTNAWQNLIEGSSAGGKFVLSPVGDIVDADTDEKKADYARAHALTVNHPVGTARMGGKKGGVVDSKLFVKGASGLRVVDASVFPKISECHPQALVYTIAERAADLIKLAHVI